MRKKTFRKINRGSFFWDNMGKKKITGVIFCDFHCFDFKHAQCFCSLGNVELFNVVYAGHEAIGCVNSLVPVKNIVFDYATNKLDLESFREEFKRKFEDSTNCQLNLAHYLLQNKKPKEAWDLIEKLQGTKEFEKSYTTIYKCCELLNYKLASKLAEYYAECFELNGEVSRDTFDRLSLSSFHLFYLVRILMYSRVLRPKALFLLETALSINPNDKRLQGESNKIQKPFYLTAKKINKRKGEFLLKLKSLICFFKNRKR